MAAGGQPGNNNATKNKPFAEAIQRALALRSRVDQADALLEVANKLIDLARGGDMPAIKELADRVDGKVAQAIIGGGPDDNPVYIVERTIVRPSQT